MIGTASRRRLMVVVRRRQQPADDPPRLDVLRALAERLHVEAVARRPDELRALALDLGVTFDSLFALEVGVDGHGVSYWPMRGPCGRTWGLRTRDRAGRKRAVPGSRSGYFGPEQLLGRGSLLVVEGASDTAAGMCVRKAWEVRR